MASEPPTTLAVTLITTVAYSSSALYLDSPSIPSWVGYTLGLAPIYYNILCALVKMGGMGIGSSRGIYVAPIILLGNHAISGWFKY